jgi:hypothetical protein
MPTIINPRTGAIVRVPYGDEKPGDINAQGGVEGDPYGPNPAAPADPMAPRVRYDPDGRRVGVSYPKQTVVIDEYGNPRITIAEDFVADPRPAAGRVGRDPSAAALDQAQLDRLRQQIDMEPDKFGLEQTVQLGRLDVSREELALQREFGTIDRALRQAEFEFKKFADGRDFAAAEKWRAAADELARRKAVVEERLASVQEADQRVRNLDVNLRRNEQAGFVVDAEGTGLEAGTLTAAERQRRFEGMRSVGQAVQAQQERQLDRQREDARFTATREDNAIQRDLQQMAVEEQRRQATVANQQAVAQRQRPSVFTPGLVVSRAGAF